MALLYRQFSIFRNLLCIVISYCSFLFTDKAFLNIIYWIKYGEIMDLSNPKTFQEKMQWMKLYDRNPNYSLLVDKYLVKKYVSEVLGEKYIIPTLCVWESASDMDFTLLPKQFVIKCTHDSGSCRICLNKDTIDVDEYRRFFSKALKRNYYRKSREWPYKNVKPRILVEPYMNGLDDKSLIDYKFFCFGGTPMYCQVIKDRHRTMTVDFFNMNWERQSFTGLHPSLDKLIPTSSSVIVKPSHLDEMINIAERLSTNLRFCRVDLYYVNSRIYFGEITFFPNSGFGTFSPEDFNLKIGNYININQ